VEAASESPLGQAAPESPPTALEPSVPPVTVPAIEGEPGAQDPAPPAATPAAKDLPATTPAPAALVPTALGGQPGRERRPRTGHSPPARLAAVVALAAVIAAVFLLVRSLVGSNGAKTAPAPTVVKVVIPEGKTRAQIAQIAAADHLGGSYRLASRRSSLLDPTHYGAPRGTPDLEGFLFPATYDMNAGDPVSRLVREQLIAFKEHFGSSEFARAHALHVTPYQLLTVASMVEREAQLPSDRPKIAAVIYNRLRQGMPLGIDATIYYAVELRKGIATYTRELTESDLHIDSVYNTRTHTGLPPTPISNPGDASILAAANPAQAAYLYYVAGADGCGEQVFSTRLADFEANVASYQAAVKKNGGHPPTCKRK
jgi:cell division protein YceG involved in septum cleavage